METKMKGKDVLAALLFGAAGCWSAWHGLYYGQAGCALAAVLLLLCACMLLFRLLKQKPDGERKGSKFVGVLIFFAIASGLAMSFVNGVLAYRPAYTYPHYYASGRIPAFPAQIPDQAADVQFRVLGEGIIGRPSFMLSFRMDPERAAALQQETELLGTPVSNVADLIHIPADLAPDFLREQGLQDCSAYQIQDRYGKVSYAIFHNAQPLICYYQE